MALLQVDDLQTRFISRDLDNQVRVAKAINGVGFSLGRGEVLGLVGETGAGKSLTAQSMIGLLRPPAKVVDGLVEFDGRDLLSMDPGALNALRGNEIALVVQNPLTSLDPLTRIGDQLIRVHRAHRKVSVAQARERAIDMMAAVGIPAPERRMRAWPHELSGGMAQRVLIAMALINEPKLLIADEPTTGLDVTVQAQILDLLRDMVRRMDMAAIVITHDLGVVAHYCDRMAVMFAGAIVESGPVDSVFAGPAHPYTQALISATPERLALGSGAIVGGPPPDLYALPEGCHYRGRCPHAAEVCGSAPPDREIGAGQVARCHFAGNLPAAFQ
ncbi:ABC transporter ATP-binding protein [Pelagibius sp.]|uniref:ABC transporter ATP-binding protein n=1 Tax=Pelagibius sp. TaxID=1931238 RepID=UPI00260E90FD|nr:ABC transporter ATP-binding protein [Pelagibius sp.]